MYQLVEDSLIVKRLSDNACIPLDPANRDYQEYLEWLAEGNEPLPAGNRHYEEIMRQVEAGDLTIQEAD
jgi:hypothetical protein